MSKNPIQFQRGLSIGAFMELYGTEEQCRTALFNLRWPQGFSCPACANTTCCRIKRHRLYQCHRCRHQTYLTAGTLFHSTKLPLTKWFLAIYLMTQSKNGISQMELKRQVGVSINTAALMYHKIAQAMMERDDAKPLSGDIEADDAYWGGARPGKHGRGATGKTPFVAAVEKRAGRPQRIKLHVVQGFSTQALRRWTRHHIEPGSHVRTDGLPCFRVIAREGCTHEACVIDGDTDKMATFNWVNTVLSNLKTSLRGTFHKLDSVYVGRHLATFAYRFNRRFDLAQMLPRFACIAMRTPPLPRRLLSMAVSHG